MSARDQPSCQGAVVQFAHDGRNTSNSVEGRSVDSGSGSVTDTRVITIDQNRSGLGNLGVLDFTLNALILLGVGLFVGALGSGMTMRRFLRV